LSCGRYEKTFVLAALLLIVVVSILKDAIYRYFSLPIVAAYSKVSKKTQENEDNKKQIN
jgi:hypothetical protein